MSVFMFQQNLRRILSRLIDQSPDDEVAIRVGAVLLNLQSYDQLVDFTTYVKDRRDAVIYYRRRGELALNRLVIKP